MKFLIILALIGFNLCSEDSDNQTVQAPSQFFNPIKFFNKCISDHECQTGEYCDHTGINPFGSCKEGKKQNESCVFDRHCKSKYCHHFKCVSKKPVKDGLCSKDAHTECLQEQFCSKSGDKYKCQDRKCSGFCCKDAQCLSNKCAFYFLCRKPDNGCNVNSIDKTNS